MGVNERIKGQVTRGVGGNYEVLTKKGRIPCLGRGKLRLDGDIFIGDYVEITLYASGKGSIEKILPRKNKLTRPYITNVDTVVICLAPLPQPDYLLIDKLLINAVSENIEPIICLNKIDLADQAFIEFVHNCYGGLAHIVHTSAITGEGEENLREILRNKYVCLAGQSAVGKSSIINMLVGKEVLEVGELSIKSERGKHCTRHVQIYDIGEGIRLADTCGFSSLEMPDIPPSELASYYTDFDEFRMQCKYNTCTHTKEPDCGVKEAVEKGKLSRARYDRYIELYEDISKKWRKRYD